MELTTRRMYADDRTVFIEVRKKYHNKALRTFQLITKEGRLCTKCLRRKDTKTAFGICTSSNGVGGRNTVCKECVSVINSVSYQKRKLRNSAEDSVMKSLEKAGRRG